MKNVLNKLWFRLLLLIIFLYGCTDDKKTEKISIIGQFTSRLAHDIRNPLSKLRMSHEILCNNPNLNVLEKVTV